MPNAPAAVAPASAPTPSTPTPQNGPSNGATGSTAPTPTHGRSNGTPAPVDGQPTGTPPPDPAQATSTLPQRVKVKVGDQEQELPLDEVVAAYQIRRASEQRFREAAEQMKQLQSVVQALKANPFAVLQQLGVDPDALLQQRLAERAQLEAMNPDQRAVHEHQQRLQAMEREKQELTRQLQQERERQLMAQHSARLDQEFSAALADANLPKIPFTISRLATLMHENLKNNMGYSLKQVVDHVRQEFQEAQKALMGGMTGEQLMQYVPEATANEIRKADLARLKTDPPPPRRQSPPAVQREKRAWHGTSEDDFMANLERFK